MSFATRLLLPRTGVIGTLSASASLSSAPTFCYQHSLLHTRSLLSGTSASSRPFLSILSPSVPSLSSTRSFASSSSSSRRPAISLNSLSDNPGAKRPVSTHIILTHCSSPLNTHHTTHHITEPRPHLNTYHPPFLRSHRCLSLHYSAFAGVEVSAQAKAKPPGAATKAATHVTPPPPSPGSLAAKPRSTACSLSEASNNVTSAH